MNPNINLNILFITPYLPSENSGHAGAQLIYRNVVGLSEYNKITIASFIDVNEEDSLDNLASYGIDTYTISYPRNQKSPSGKINSVFRNSSHTQNVCYRKDILLVYIVDVTP